MSDETGSGGETHDYQNPLAWLITVALKIGIARLTEFILDALDL